MLVLREEFVRANPVDLHYLYGANCYQHAIGFKPTVIHVEKLHDDQEIEGGFYVGLSPAPAIKLNHAENLAAFKQEVLDGCKLDEMIDLGDRPEHREGYRTLALFFGNHPERAGYDFHFAFLNDNGLWEDKLPFRGPRTYVGITDIERSTGYKFHGYLLAPEHMTPSSMKTLHTTPVRVEDDGHEAEFLRVDGVDDPNLVAARQMIFDPGEQLGFAVEEGALVPLPAMSASLVSPALKF